MRLRRLAVPLLAGVAACASAQTHTKESQPQIRRTVLRQAPIPGTELEMRVVLIEYPPGASSPVHHHPVAGINYVLEGVAESAFGSEAPHTYRAGESFMDEAMEPHTVFRNASQTQPLRFLAYYAIHPGEPTLIVP